MATYDDDPWDTRHHRTYHPRFDRPTVSVPAAR